MARRSIVEAEERLQQQIKEKRMQLARIEAEVERQRLEIAVMERIAVDLAGDEKGGES